VNALTNFLVRNTAFFTLRPAVCRDIVRATGRPASFMKKRQNVKFLATEGRRYGRTVQKHFPLRRIDDQRSIRGRFSATFGAGDGLERDCLRCQRKRRHHLPLTQFNDLSANQTSRLIAELDSVHERPVFAAKVSD
jgi:hypothetical protein